MKGVIMKEGDVFSVPVANNILSLGQIVTRVTDGVYYGTFSPPIEAIQKADGLMRVPTPLLATLFMDGKLHNGAWKTMYNAEIPPEVIKFPCFRVEVNGHACVDSVDSSRSRRATAEEAAVLLPKSIVSPARIERMLRAHVGLEPWNESFNAHLHSARLLAGWVSV